jgi:hypothetical protein
VPGPAGADYAGTKPNSVTTRDAATSSLNQGRVCDRPLVVEMCAFMAETGYEELLYVIKLVTESIGRRPVVFDGTRFQTNPLATIQRFCKAVDLPFFEKFLSWTARMPTERLRRLERSVVVLDVVVRGLGPRLIRN